MHKSNDERSATVRLGSAIRTARKSKGITIQALAESIGRPREWLNRVELGYSDHGEYSPPSISDVHVILDALGDECFSVPRNDLLELCEQATEDFRSIRSSAPQQRRQSFGKLTQTEIIVGEAQIIQAIEELVSEQHSEAIIRNTGIKVPGNYTKLTKQWERYRHELGKFLALNPKSLFKRVEYVSSVSQLNQAKEADSKLTGGRSFSETHNAKVKFYKHNPLQLHVLIGQREAILALPQVSGQSGSNIALLIRDKIFVEALRVWYDEVLWDAPGENRTVDFQKFEESFADIKSMIGLSEK